MYTLLKCTHSCTKVLHAGMDKQDLEAVHHQKNCYVKTKVYGSSSVNGIKALTFSHMHLK